MIDLAHRLRVVAVILEMLGQRDDVGMDVPEVGVVAVYLHGIGTQNDAAFGQQ